MQLVKGCSSKWINENRLANGWFSWQEGYGAFSYSKDEIPTIIRYIENQAEHHKQQDMVDEYKQMLEENEVEYDEQKIFKQVECFVEKCIFTLQKWSNNTTVFFSRMNIDTYNVYKKRTVYQ